MRQHTIRAIAAASMAVGTAAALALPTANAATRRSAARARSQPPPPTPTAATSTTPLLAGSTIISRVPLSTGGARTVRFGGRTVSLSKVAQSTFAAHRSFDQLLRGAAGADLAGPPVTIEEIVETAHVVAIQATTSFTVVNSTSSTSFRTAGFRGSNHQLTVTELRS